MRIIAGTAKGRRLKGPVGRATRPTPDRVRESVFSILGDRVPGSRVLDLFAGTGAMGLEALSRGAEKTVFVEKDPAALRVLESNVSACGFGERSIVVPSAVDRFLMRGDFGGGFDLVFADPPYGGEEGSLTLMALSKRAKSLPGSLVVLEHAPGDPVIQPPDLPVIDSRKYGNTALTFFRVTGRGNSS